MVWTPPNWNAGQYPTAAEAEALSDQIADLTHPGWVDVSTALTITGATTSPTLGNSTRQALYRRVPEGDIVYYTFKLTIGSTFSAGSGIYSFSLPFTMLSPNIFNGTCTFFDSGTAFRTANLVPVDANNLITYADGSGAALGSGGPGTAWATGDYVSAQLWYAPA